MVKNTKEAEKSKLELFYAFEDTIIIKNVKNGRLFHFDKKINAFRVCNAVW